MVMEEKISELEDRLDCLERKQDKIIDILQDIASFLKTIPSLNKLESDLDLSLQILGEQ